VARAVPRIFFIIPINMAFSVGAFCVKRFNGSVVVKNGGVFASDVHNFALSFRDVVNTSHMDFFIVFRYPYSNLFGSDCQKRDWYYPGTRAKPSAGPSAAFSPR